MPPRTIEEWMKEHVVSSLRYLPRDVEGIRLTQCAAMAALGWIGLLCLAWCGSGCGGQAFSTLEDPKAEATTDAEAVPVEASIDAAYEASLAAESSDEPVDTKDAGTETGPATADACVLTTTYDCGPNGMGSGRDWWATPPQTFCMVSNNLQRFSSPVPTGCNTCETFNCKCIAATELCRGMTCSDQGGHVIVTCGK